MSGPGRGPRPSYSEAAPACCADTPSVSAAIAAAAARKAFLPRIGGAVYASVSGLAPVAASAGQDFEQAREALVQVRAAQRDLAQRAVRAASGDARLAQQAQVVRAGRRGQ